MPVGKRPSQEVDLHETGGATERRALDVALAREASIQVVPTPLKNATLSLNGLAGEHVAIATDGDPVVGRVEGAFDARGLPLGSAERVAIYQGLNSLPFGSQNIAGVINVESPWSVEPNTDLSWAMGSLGRMLIRASTQRSSAWTSFSNWRSEAVVHPERPQNTLSNAVTRTGVDAGAVKKNVFTSRGRSFDARVTGLFIDQNQKGLFGGERTLQDQNRYGAAIDLKSGDSSFRVSWNRFESKFQGLATDDSPNRQDRESEQLWRFGPQIEENISGTTLLAGVQGELHEISSSRLPDARTVSTTRVNPYLGARRAFPLNTVESALVVGAGTRYDSNPKLWSPRAEIAHTVQSSLGTHETTLHSGLGFRDVTAKEKYLEFENSAVGYRVIGNPALQMERAWISELKHSLLAGIDRFEVGISAVRVSDAIGYVPTQTNSGIWSYDNVGNTQTFGARAQWAHYFGNEFNGRLQWLGLRGRNLSTNGDLFLQPTHRVSLQFGRSVTRGFSFLGTAVWTARQAFFDANRNGLTDDEWIASFWNGALEASYGFRLTPIADVFTFFVRGDNLLDVVRPKTFPIEPRTFLAGLRAEL